MTFKKRRAVLALPALMALTTSGPALAGAIVGGIDFGNVGLFAHLETATVASTFVNGTGQVSQSYGLISSINGDSSYCADGSANCALYFIRSSTVSATPGSELYFSGVNFAIYYSAVAAVNLQGQGSAANLVFISGLTKWATFQGENGVDPTAAGLVSSVKMTQALTAASITASGGGLMSVNKGDGLGNVLVEAYLDANTIPTFTGAFADIAYTESINNFVLNPFDLAGAGGDSCLTGSPQVGDWCLAGSSDLRGRTVLVNTLPAPGSAPLSLLALGLMGFAAFRRATRG